MENKGILHSSYTINYYIRTLTSNITSTDTRFNTSSPRLINSIHESQPEVTITLTLCASYSASATHGDSRTLIVD